MILLPVGLVLLLVLWAFTGFASPSRLLDTFWFAYGILLLFAWFLTRLLIGIGRRRR